MTSNPDITVDDYLTGKFFRPIYKYLTLNMLSGNNDTDRKIILMFENYYREGKLLYKVTPTRGHKEKRFASSHHQLCIAKKYTTKLLNKWHSLLGHYSSRKLLPTLQMRYWWSAILTDVKNVPKTVTCANTLKYYPNKIV